MVKSHLKVEDMQTIANKVQLIGHLGMDPEVKNFENGNLVKVSIATDASYKDKEGKKVEDTHWHNLVAWGKTADLAEKMFKKGKKVAIEGTLISRSYDDKEGVKRYITEVRVDQFLMLDKKES